MAVYKVPQDVEAEDKLLGPFSFKQFIFLIIMVASIGLAYVFSRILMPLAIIPLPIAIFFGVLALPLRKDQPMEIYLAAIISFILKPKIRHWHPDGIEAMIEVIAPKSEERQYGKGYSEEEVQRRLSYLANLVDSRGWSVRGVQEPDSSMREDLYNEAQSVDDLLDDDGNRAQQIDNLLLQKDNARRQELMTKMQQPTPPQPIAPTVIEPVQPEPIIYNHVLPQASTQYTPMAVVQPSDPSEDIKLVVNPYPSMNQSVLQPISQTAPTPPTQPTPASAPQPIATPVPTPSLEPVSPVIIDLAKNHADLSVETLQREANRIKQKEESEEVIISFR